MKRPLIGVTGSARRWSPSWWCIRIALLLTGCRAHRISTLNPDLPRGLDGLIISGGDDIHPELYTLEEAVEETDDYDPERDQMEIACIHHAIAHSKPLLGICRGAQLINVVRKGTLHRDISTMRKITTNRSHLAPLKTVNLDEDSLLAKSIHRRVLKVNSLHHQAVDQLGHGLNCVGRDLDDIVQAIEDGDHIIGVQWHPEYLFIFPGQLAVFRWLRDTCRARAERP